MISRLARTDVQNGLVLVALCSVLLVLAAGALASSEDLRVRVVRLEADRARAEARADASDRLILEWSRVALDLSRRDAPAVPPPAIVRPAVSAQDGRLCGFERADLAPIGSDSDPWLRSVDARWRRWDRR